MTQDKHKITITVEVETNSINRAGDAARYAARKAKRAAKDKLHRGDNASSQVESIERIETEDE